MRELTTKNTIVCVNKIELRSVGDIDIEMKYDVIGKELADAAYEDDCVHLIEKGLVVDCYPIKIKELKKILSKLEKEGCNYVSIDYNCDHPDYTFFGSDVHVATEDEILEEEKKELDSNMQEYQNILKRIEREKEKIENEIKRLRK